MPKTYDWESAYWTAITETQWTSVISEKIRIAEDAIMERRRTLTLSGGDSSEVSALFDALIALKRLRRDVDTWKSNQAIAIRPLKVRELPVTKT